jgi:hypothetical protein
VGCTDAAPAVQAAFEMPIVRAGSRKKQRQQQSNNIRSGRGEGSLTTRCEGDGGKLDDISMQNVMKLMVLQHQMDQDYRRHQEKRLDEEAKEQHEEAKERREEACINRYSNATIQQLLAAILALTTRHPTNSDTSPNYNVET